MLARRIIPCLDVRHDVVVKGVQFRNHEVVGEIVDLAQRYSSAGADELVFYDITASSDGRSVDYAWVERVAEVIDIPFCVAGGIRDTATAELILQKGADKISINSPALADPVLITTLNRQFGQQCVVIGIDSYFDARLNDYVVKQYTGDPDRTRTTRWRTRDWVHEAQSRGAGEIVLNCMNQDGMRQGYDIDQLAIIRDSASVPLIASGGAGAPEHFRDVFQKADVDGALAASVFHKGVIPIPALKSYLISQGVEIRP